MSELVIACKALPDFKTLQILHFPTTPPHPICWCGHHGLSTKQWEQALKEQGEVMKGLAMDSLETPKTECQEGGGRKRTTVRVVKLTRAPYTRPGFHPGYVNIEECEV